MKVIVCGAGQVGFNIARHLSQEDNDVIVVDQSAELTKKIGNSLKFFSLIIKVNWKNSYLLGKIIKMGTIKCHNLLLGSE